MTTRDDVLVIGAGLAGLTAAWRAATRGLRVRLIAKGWGATHWHSGCIDLLGYWPLGCDTAVSNPHQTIQQLCAAQPTHPYALIGLEQLENPLKQLQQLSTNAGYPLAGAIDKNWLLPSAVGTFRPTCLAPVTMTAGDLTQKTPMLLVGFRQMVDFFPNVAADNLTAQGIPARHVFLDLPALAGRHNTNAVILARMLEQKSFRADVAAAVRPHMGEAARIGFPAVLGTQAATTVHDDLQNHLGRPVFEIPGLPPSVAGMRLHHLLKTAIEAKGGRVFEGLEAVGFEADEGRVTAVYTESAARQRAHRYRRYVLATGGILGGGLLTTFDGQIKEGVFDLPLQKPENHLNWFQRDFLDKQGHPIYRSGVPVNADFQPLAGDGRALYANLYAAGTTLAPGDYIRERSFEGVAVGSGFAVGEAL